MSKWRSIFRWIEGVIKWALGNALWDWISRIWSYWALGAAAVTAIITGGLGWVKGLPIWGLILVALFCSAVTCLLFLAVRAIWLKITKKNPPAVQVLPVGYRDELIRRGQSLVEQWTTPLDYPEKQQRENDSKNWLCEAGDYAKKHLTNAQMNEFTLRHNLAASGGKKYDFAMALDQAGTVASSEDGNLAFEIFGKLTLLERFRSEPSPTQDKLRKSRSPEVTRVIDDAKRLLRENPGLNNFSLRALQLAGVGDLQTEEDFAEVREAIIQHGFTDPVVGMPSLYTAKNPPKWLKVIKSANRNQVALSRWEVLMDCVREYSKRP